MDDDKAVCDGCRKVIEEGEDCWISEIGEETVVTHPIAECLIKLIGPEPGWIGVNRRLRLVKK